MPIEIRHGPALYDAALKLHRAGEHLDALDAEVAAFLQRNDGSGSRRATCRALPHLHAVKMG